MLGKLISVKSLPPVGIEPATQRPLYFQSYACPTVLIPQVLIEGSLTSLLFVHQMTFGLRRTVRI